MDYLTICFLVTLTASYGFSQEAQDYCEGETFSANCPDNHVVIIQQALYGRMQLGRCIQADVGHVGCANDVKRIMDEQCSGRRSCELKVTDLLGPEITHNCGRDYRSYLEASYTCVPVITPGRRDCRSTTGALHRPGGVGGGGQSYGGSSSSSSLVRVVTPSGYIASVVTEDTGCGGIDAPWLVSVPQGQKINITLWDFSKNTGTTSDGHASVCHVYAIIKDRDTQTSRTLCGAEGPRVAHVYLSDANNVEIRVVIKPTSDAGDSAATRSYFMLQYKAIGCADPVVPLGGYMSRTDQSAVIGCRDTNTKWRLTCVGTRWAGTHGNCSNGVAAQSSGSGIWGIMSDAHGISVAIIVGVAVLVGLVILVIGLVCLRSMRRQHAMLKRTPDQYTAGSTVGAYPGAPDMYGRHLRSYGPGQHRNGSMDKACEPLDPAAVAAANTIAGGTGSLGPAGMENKYYRTWQLQQHSKPGEGVPQPPPTYGPGADTLPYVEHIYESPKFEHKDYSTQPRSTGAGVDQHYDDSHPGAGGGSVQYFELDPHDTDTVGGGGALAGIHPRSTGGVYNAGALGIDGKSYVSC